MTEATITMKRENIQTQPPTMRDVLRSATAEAADSDLDRHRASGARLLATTQERLAEAQKAYTVEQARMRAEQEHRLATLAAELREERRAFELTRQRRIAELQRQVQALTDMRDAAEGMGLTF